MSSNQALSASTPVLVSHLIAWGGKTTLGDSWCVAWSSLRATPALAGQAERKVGLLLVSQMWEAEELQVRLLPLFPLA